MDEKKFVENCRLLIQNAMWEKDLKREFAFPTTASSSLMKKGGLVKKEEEICLEDDEGETGEGFEVGIAPYDGLIQQIANAKEDSLWIWFTALNQCTSILDRKILSQSMKKMDWTKTDAKWRRLYISFLVNFLSGHGQHSFAVFAQLIPLLFPVYTVSWKQRKEAGKYADFEEVRKVNEEETQIVHSAIHQALRAILTVVPSAPSVLIKVIQKVFPHKSHSKEKQTTYLKNCLIICEYCPVLLLRVLQFCIEKIVQIDVEIVLDDVLEEDDDHVFGGQKEKEKEEEENVLQFEMEECGEVVGQKKIREMADKLDMMMETMFQFISHFVQGEEKSSSLSSSSETKSNASSFDPTDSEVTLSRERVNILFDYLLFGFDQLIIRTHKSKYTQFLIYYFLSLGTEKSEDFVGYLFNTFLDKAKHETVRLCALQYVASFIARAPFVSPELIRKSVFVLLQEAHKYVDEFGHLVPDSDQHRLFYMVMQAVYYVFCFRQCDILDTPFLDSETPENVQVTGKEFFNQLNFQRLNESQLNPFKICQENVVNEFCRMTEERGLLHNRLILKMNRKIAVAPSKYIDSDEAGLIDGFFPFDPYLLKSSSRFICDRYREWQHSGDLDDSSDFYSSFQSDSESEEEEEEEASGLSESYDMVGSYSASTFHMETNYGSVDEEDFAMKAMSLETSKCDIFSDWNFNG